jgi:hypothetical protein
MEQVAPDLGSRSILATLPFLLARECIDRILGFWMVALFDVGSLSNQPSTDSHEGDEQDNKADHSPEHGADCEHERHSVRLP